MRAPIAFTYGNCVFADGMGDAWAAFSVETSSYQWLGVDAKRTRFRSLLCALEALEADTQILRVGARADTARYAGELEAESGQAGRPHVRLRQRYVAEHVRRLAQLGGARAVLFLLVSLRDPQRDVATYVSRFAEQGLADWWESLRGAFSLRDRRMLKVSELERVRVLADQAHARLADYLPVREARGAELQWLVRRAFCRGLAEPHVDGLHEPRALAFERNGEAVLAPLEGDVMRWGSLVPFPWFFLLALDWGFRPLAPTPRTVLSGAKCLVSGRQTRKTLVPSSR
jgi:hypothetical protein